jgi:hypothetical protein
MSESIQTQCSIAAETDVRAIRPPVAENILIAAYQVVAERRSVEPAELIATYEQHFTSAVTKPLEHPPEFSKFSLVDPQVTLTLRSSTGVI